DEERKARTQAVVGLSSPRRVGRLAKRSLAGHIRSESYGHRATRRVPCHHGCDADTLPNRERPRTRETRTSDDRADARAASREKGHRAERAAGRLAPLEQPDAKAGADRGADERAFRVAAVRGFSTLERRRHLAERQRS